jgi:hypothetical protein
VVENKLPKLADVRRRTMCDGDKGTPLDVCDGDPHRGDSLPRTTASVDKAKAKPDHGPATTVVDLFAAVTRRVDVDTSVIAHQKPTSGLRGAPESEPPPQQKPLNGKNTAMTIRKAISPTIIATSSHLNASPTRFEDPPGGGDHTTGSG